jgi:hypothetical protein
MQPRLVEHAAGFTWIAPEPPLMERASHALVADGRVWVVDPVDYPGLDDALRARGAVAAVVQLLDRHPRDCAALAARLGVPHLRLPTGIPASPFEVVSAMSFPKWREVALWWPGARVLVVPEAVGTVPYYRARSENLAVHPMLRLTPPRALRRFKPDLLLVGHGDPLAGPSTAEALTEALRTARRRLPSWLVTVVTTHRRRPR